MPSDLKATGEKADDGEGWGSLLMASLSSLTGTSTLNSPPYTPLQIAKHFGYKSCVDVIQDALEVNI